MKPEKTRPKEKKVYVTPRLTVHGNVQKITGRAGGLGDGTTPPKTV
jgi:hypothetical protein